MTNAINTTVTASVSVTIDSGVSQMDVQQATALLGATALHSIEDATTDVQRAIGGKLSPALHDDLFGNLGSSFYSLQFAKGEEETEPTHVGVATEEDSYAIVNEAINNVLQFANNGGAYDAVMVANAIVHCAALANRTQAIADIRSINDADLVIEDIEDDVIISE